MFQYEPRSKNYYDEDDSDASQSSWDWNFILWFPVIVLILFLIGLAPLLMWVGYFLNDVYSTLKKTIASGKLAYPFLAKAGVVVACILACFLLTHSDTPIKPSLVFVLSIGFVLFFTVFPTIALGLHWLRKVHSH